MKFKRVAVIGSSGQLGKAIVRLIAPISEEVLALDIMKSEGVLDNVKSYEIDIRDKNQLLSTLTDVQVVIHTASMITFNPKKTKDLFEVNVQGTQNILEVCIENTIEQLVYTSSIDVVFDGTPISMGNEELPIIPAKQFLDKYSESKAEAEKLVTAHKDKIRVCSLRTAGIYGPGDSARFPQVIGAMQSGQYRRMGDGTAKFNHVYVDNAAHAHLKAAEALIHSKINSGEVYFIVDYEASNFYEFVEDVCRKVGINIPDKSPLSQRMALGLAGSVEFLSKMPWGSKSKEPLFTKYSVYSTTVDFYFSGQKAKEELEYEPIITFEEAISNTVEWIKTKLKREDI